MSPIYEFGCPEHGRFDHFRIMADCSRPESCPQCKRESPRLMSLLTVHMTEKPQLRYGCGSPGRMLTKQETGGMNVFIPSFGAMEQAEVDDIALAAIDKEQTRVKALKGRPRSRNQERIQALGSIAMKAPRGERRKAIQEALRASGDKVTVLNSKT